MRKCFVMLGLCAGLGLLPSVSRADEPVDDNAAKDEAKRQFNAGTKAYGDIAWRSIAASVPTT